MNDCIFCKIIAGEIPTNKVYEDDLFLVILDVQPIKPGHLLLIPKEHTDDVFAVENSLYTKLFELAKKLAPQLKEAMGTVRVGLAIEGFGVPHVHVHLVPIDQGNELNPEHAQKMSSEELYAIAEKLREQLQ